LVGSIDGGPSVGIGVEHLLSGMAIGIVPTDRNNGMPGVHLLQPISLQRATRTMVWNFQDIDSIGPTVLTHAPHSLLLDIGCEEHSVIAARQPDNNGAIVERMPFPAPSGW
jgi:hypothetical protein